MVITLQQILSAKRLLANPHKFIHDKFILAYPQKFLPSKLTRPQYGSLVLGLILVDAIFSYIAS